MIISGSMTLKSAAGYYVGRICYDEGCLQPYDRDTSYFPTKEAADKCLEDYEKDMDEFVETYEEFIKRLKNRGIDV